MKIMSVLSDLAQELYQSVSDRLDAPLRESIHEDLDCGEEGVAVMRILDWAVSTGTPISEKYWTSLNEFCAPLTTLFSESTRTQLAAVQHAA
jgi:hypothetical protein